MSGEELAVQIRHMRRSDIEAGLRLCRLAGWDQVHRDWERFIEGPDSSARASVHNDDVMATVSTMRYGSAFGWIGMVLVDPAAQGRGMGSTIVRAAVESLSDMPSVRLDATPAGRLVYQKLDFRDECSVVRMEGRSIQVGAVPRIVRPMTLGEISEVTAMDGPVFGAPRSNLLQWMHEGAPEFAFVAERHLNLCGYVLGRHGHQFEHIGPLVADDLQVAMSLCKACLSRHQDQAFVIDTPQRDDGWMRFLESMGFRVQRPFMRMHRGKASASGTLKHQFAVLGPEFG